MDPQSKRMAAGSTTLGVRIWLVIGGLACHDDNVVKISERLVKKDTGAIILSLAKQLNCLAVETDNLVHLLLNKSKIRRDYGNNERLQFSETSSAVGGLRTR